MTSRVDRLRDSVARMAARIAARREEQLAKDAEMAGAGAGPRPGTGSGAGAGSSAGSPSGAESASGGARSGGTPAPPPGGPAGALPAAGAGKPAPATAVPWGMRVAAEAGWRLLVLAGVVWVLIQVISSISLLVLSFSAGLLVTALLQPTVARLRRHRVGRGLATTITFVTGFVVMGLIGWFVVWQVTENLPTLTDRVQEAIQEGKRWAIQGPFHVSKTQVNDIAKNLSQWLGDNSQEVTSAGLAGVTVLLEFLSGAVLTMFITLFLLYDGRGIWGWFLKLVPRNAREGVAGAGPRAWITLTGYVRGTVIVALIDAIFIGVGIFILKVPLAVPLAVLIFIFAFVPIVGAVVSGALAVLVAFVTNGPITGLLVLAVVLLVQQIESHILQPFILGRLVRVHPLAVVLAVTGGSLIAGIPGAVVAVPLVAVLNTAVGYLKAYSEGQRGAGPGIALAGAAAESGGPGGGSSGAAAGGTSSGSGRTGVGGVGTATEPGASPTESADAPPPPENGADTGGTDSDSGKGKGKGDGKS
ncbi:AI-2E family transporter [Streptomyces sp. HNM0575]|uniref:AI-2E family transporter n=1 Tax=Streptomyces sp. HNM0575 TaxID=2716338 RepID=UPI00145D54B2|nr:AI-2E family transporter [Streptomyces sp. HNM0575]NLU72171.1 AI-2E family transporter [Streptomyces sp. HNM0575]